MAHQTHTLPWNVLERNFEYRPAIPVSATAQSLPDIVALQKPLQTEDLLFFSNALAKQTRDFSNFLRQRFCSKAQYAKTAARWLTSDEYEAMPGASTTGKVISERMMEKWRDKDSAHSPSQSQASNSQEDPYADVETWIRAARWTSQGELFYDEKGENKMPGVVKMLLKEAAGVIEQRTVGQSGSGEGEICDEAMETLLLVANHPKTPLMTLRNSGSELETGISSILKSCLHAYLMVNLLFIMREAGSPVCDQLPWDWQHPFPNGVPPQWRYMKCRNFRAVVEFCTLQGDVPGRAGVHDEFFKQGDLFSDMNACQEYLKSLWRIMVVYDLVIREGGGDPDMGQEITRSFQSMFQIPYEIEFGTNRIKLVC
ncbi:hypothetical protein G7Y89_g12533 [Cudoniella acicularis]|uniref:Uncharacterized protein n=1 Tax=Cudoniella acicularis TaxID=354080 RepID=A0A8H4VZK2_9HELO|nr:hypothetical protein G7Y89_g12533 [Cudoniella acicularis]